MTQEIVWKKGYNERLMYGTEIATGDRLSACLIYGGLGGGGDPTEGYVVWGRGFRGAEVFRLAGETLSADEARSALIVAMNDAEQLLSGWKVTARGNGDDFCLSKVRDGKKLIMGFSMRAAGARAFWADADLDWIWSDPFKIFGQVVSFDSLGEALRSADALALPTDQSGRRVYI